MNFNCACEKALKYYKNEWDDIGLAGIYDLGEKWLFYGRDKQDKRVYGKPGITINKKTGEQDYFYLPDDDNFRLMEDAEEIEVPKIFRELGSKEMNEK